MQKPTHKVGDLGQQELIQRAITPKSKGLKPKSEFRTFPLIKRPGNLDKKHPVNYETVPVYTVPTKQSPEARELPQGKDNRISRLTQFRQFHVL